MKGKLLTNIPGTQMHSSEYPSALSNTYQFQNVGSEFWWEVEAECREHQRAQYRNLNSSHMAMHASQFC